MKKINCAIIGFGNVGKLQANFIVKNKNTNLVYVCEKNLKIIKKNEFKFKDTKWILNENIIFNDNDIDLVIICTYDNFHFDQIIKCIKFKKNIFCEKPFCQNLTQLKKINKYLIKNQSIKFSSNLILRTISEFKYLKKIIDNKKIGDLYYSEADYNYGRLNKITKGWRGSIPFYSVISGGGVHVIDLICYLLEEYPSSVYAAANKIVTKKSKFRYNDFIVSILRFKSQNISKITANFGSTTKHHHQIKIFGTKGTFLKEYENSRLIMNRDNAEKRVKNLSFEKKYNKNELLKIFIKSMNKKSLYHKMPTYNESMKVMLICFAIEKSFKTNKEIKIDYKKLSLS